MKAATVESYDHPPRYGDFEKPAPQKDEVLVKVSAAAISQLVRIQASGKHYVRHTPPFVPGADGVGFLEDGTRVYFAFPRPPVGAMAEYVVVDSANIVPLPSDLNACVAAAIANPGMSSWAALTERTQLAKGESVLVNGATGASGRLAIQIAKHLGAARVIATGRSEKHRDDMLALGADEYLLIDEATTVFTQQLHNVFSQGIDVVLDYLWGKPAECIMDAAKYAQKDGAAQRIRFINMGALAGANISLPANPLRSSGLELMGAGLGSLSTAALIRSIRQLLNSVVPLGLKIDCVAHPIADVESVWNTSTEARIVLSFNDVTPSR